VSKIHFRRRGGVVHISPEAQAAYDYFGSRPSDLCGLGADLVCLLNAMEAPSPKISQQVLAGLAAGIDMHRLMLAAIPSESVKDLEYKKVLFQDRDSFVPTSALLPLLLEGSIVSDEFRLGLRKRRRLVE